jgi:hypothetical protein
MGAGANRAARIVAGAAILGLVPTLAASSASAAPRHTSCRALGEATAAEARDHAVAPEILTFAPGSVDDLLALVQVGGSFEGEVVEPLCLPR